MSSDDYVYVLETPSECTCGYTDDDDNHAADCAVAWGNTQYRVRHVAGGYWDNEEEMFSAFRLKGTPIFYNKAHALLRAHDLDKEVNAEYGVHVIKSDNPVGK